LFLFHAPANTDIHPLSLHDALPIWMAREHSLFCHPRYPVQRNIFQNYAESIAAGDFDRRNCDMDWSAAKIPAASSGDAAQSQGEIGRAHVLTPVTSLSRMPSSA